jgi:3-phenylpropionate/trans-cinnamate dioxygenase ferredoxin reductase subunit
MRTEHWTNAVEQAAAAARNLLLGPTGGEAYSPVPYVWSDQYDKKLQYVGVVGDYLGVREGSIDEGRFVAAFGTGGRLVGALCVNWPARMVRYRRAIAAGTRLEQLDAALA